MMSAPSVIRSNTRCGDQHDHEHRRQRQRHSGGHHDADAPPEADQAHHHDHAQGDEELDHELVDRFGDVHRLIADLRERKAGRQLRGNLAFLRIERLAQIGGIPPFFHDDAERHRRLAVMPDQEGRGVFIATSHLGDVRQLERPSRGPNGRVCNPLQIIIGAVDADEDLRTLGIDRARRRHNVLARETLEDLASTDAQVRQPGIRELHEDPFRPLSEDIDFLHARNVEQALAQCFRFPRQLSRRHAPRLDRIERELHIGILIVDERPRRLQGG